MLFFSVNKKPAEKPPVVIRVFYIRLLLNEFVCFLSNSELLVCRDDTDSYLGGRLADDCFLAS